MIQAWLPAQAAGWSYTIDDDAENKGGLNIFGRGFGNHAQDIIMQIDYD